MDKRKRRLIIRLLEVYKEGKQLEYSEFLKTVENLLPEQLIETKHISDFMDKIGNNNLPLELYIIPEYAFKERIFDRSLTRIITVHEIF